MSEFPFDNPRTGDAVPQPPDMPPEDSNGNCDAGICTCDNDFACPAGWDCVQGRCLQDCDDDRDCESGWFCEDGECISAELISP